jgi:hypothetical protein
MILFYGLLYAVLMYISGDGNIAEVDISTAVICGVMFILASLYDINLSIKNKKGDF